MNLQTRSWRVSGTILLMAFLPALAACAPLAPPPTAEITQEKTTELANPASLYCLEQGGNLAMEERGDGDQFGVCYFEDNRQCEEWALLRSDCPVGGLRVTGYITEAARYCAITGACIGSPVAAALRMSRVPASSTMARSATSGIITTGSACLGPLHPLLKAKPIPTPGRLSSRWSWKYVTGRRRRWLIS